DQEHRYLETAEARASVNKQALTCDETSFLPSKKYDRCRNLLGLSEPLHGHAPQIAGFAFATRWIISAEQFCLCRARSDGIRRNAICCELNRHGARQAFECCFCRCVTSTKCEPPSNEARDVDNAAESSRAHIGQYGFGQLQRWPNV